MTIAVTEADEYKYDLSDELKKIAELELRESYATIQHALGALREWAEQNPRIAAIRLDSMFLLRFLRAKKFSIPLTQESIERYLLLRETFDGRLFKNLTYDEHPLTELYDNGFIFAVPNRDSQGRRIIFTRAGIFDPSKHAKQHLLRAHALVYETLLENEENQIRGFIHIIDAGGIGFNYMTILTPKELFRIVKNGENTIPMRHKSINGFNINSSIKFAIDFAMSIVSEKIKNRVKFYTSAEKIAEEIDIKLLPKEYGGIMPLEEMKKLFIKELKDNQDKIDLNDKMTVNLEMYSQKAREGAVSALKKDNGCNDPKQDSNANGMQGSFRKLEVD